MNTSENNVQTKKLYRSKRNKMIAGVCGGFAEYLNIDPVLVRIAWIAFTFLGGSGLIIYIIGIIIIPENPDESINGEHNEIKNDRGLFWGSLLILVGAALLLKQFGFFYYFNIWHLPWKSIWSLILIIIGVLYTILHQLDQKNKPVRERLTSLIFRVKNEFIGHEIKCLQEFVRGWQNTSKLILIL